MGIGSKISSRWDPKFDLEVIEFWRKNKIYEKWRLKNKGKKVFFYLDGPPYATGSIHLGTAWGKALRDMVVRFYAKNGYFVFNRPGFDMHGLPIEQKVEKALGITKKDIDKFGVLEFVNKCREFSYGNMYNMIEDFKREGVWLDWDNPYMTIANEYIERVWQIMKEAYAKGLLYEDLKVVHWCPRCQTTLSKQEVELGYMDSSKYKPSEDPSIYVKFKIKGRENEYLLIWTTTPWTLVFNLGVMANPNAIYVKVKVGNEVWIIAKDRVGELMNKFGIKEYTIIAEFLGRELEGIEYIHPFYEELKEEIDKIKEESPKALTVWLSEEYVTTEEGTGLVHAAPGCGPEDCEVGRKYGVKPWNTVDEEGIIRGLKAFEGLRAKFDDAKFIEKVRGKGLLVYEEKVVHDYPICWRCGTKLIFRATKQWYINIQKLKELLLKENAKVVWVPNNVRKAFENVIKTAPDWVITRQRYWGIPIPIWKCKNNHVYVVGSREELERLTGKKFINIYVVVEKNKYAREMLSWMLGGLKWIEKEEVNADDIKNSNEDVVFYVKRFDEKILKELDGWYYIRTYGENFDLYRIYNYDFHKPWIDNIKFKCPVCGEEMTRIPDVADVWLDSGAAFLAVFERSKQLGKVDFIVEGYDQLRGWFYTLAVEGMLYNLNIPYKAVYVHGWVNDALGRKMSKSLGNVVYPREIWDRFGADTLRLYLVSATGPYEDLNFYIQEVKNKYNTLNVLWNIHRYLIDQASYYNINPAKIDPSGLEFDIEERWILSRLNSTIKEVTELMERYQLWRVPRVLETLWLDLSREYIKQVREKLQFGDEIKKKTVLWTIFKVLYDIINMASIVVPFITEKIYQNLRKEFELDVESVHLLEWPKYEEKWIDRQLEEKYVLVSKIIEAGLRLRNKIGYGVRWPLRKLIVITSTDLKGFGNLLKSRLNVKEVEFLENIPEFVKVKVSLNYKEIGDKSLVKVFQEKLAKIDSRRLYIDIISKGSIEIDGITLEKRMLKFDFEVEGNYAIDRAGECLIIYDLSIGEDLIEEGIVREFIRRVQDARKKMGLIKKDRIDVYVKTDEKTVKILRKWENEIKKVAGIANLHFGESSNYNYKTEFKIRDRRFVLAIKLLK